MLTTSWHKIFLRLGVGNCYKTQLLAAVGQFRSSAKVKALANCKQREMDHLFNAFMSRRTSTSSLNSPNSSCDDIPDLYVTKKKVKRTSLAADPHHPALPLIV